MRTLIGDGYPDAYLELPLLGEPCLDMLSVHERIDRRAKFAPGAGFGCQAMFDWFSGVCGDGVSCGLEVYSLYSW